MGESLKKETDVKIKLVAGAGGVFDVSVDNKLIFSKHQQGRFPEPEEILSAIK